MHGFPLNLAFDTYRCSYSRGQSKEDVWLHYLDRWSKQIFHQLGFNFILMRGEDDFAGNSTVNNLADSAANNCV